MFFAGTLLVADMDITNFLCVVGEDDTPLAVAEVVEIACWVFYGFLRLLLSDLGPGTRDNRSVVFSWMKN